MFCPSCGAENPDDAAFCGACGKPLAQPSQAPQTPHEEETVYQVVDTAEASDPVPAGLKYGVLGASVLMPLIGVGMGLFYMLKGENEDKKAVGRVWLFSGLGIAFVYMFLSSGGY